MFEPGTSWQYGYSTDWVGRLVETVSGLTLEQYFQRNIFEPLGMADTSFILPELKRDRLAARFGRGPDGKLQPVNVPPPNPPQQYNGGGGLYATAADYIRFTQMFLRYGRMGATDILTGHSVAQMSTNQIGSLTAGVLKTQQPNVSSDLDAPGKWGLGFLINPERKPDGRQPGSLTWGGIFNTYFWIDPARRISAVVMMQYLPFADREAFGLMGDFERALYSGALSMD
jgi:CubicO group peptidase (beta-lactamase class C family)